MLCEKQRKGGTKEAGAWKGTYKNWERISFKNGAIVVHLQVIHKQIQCLTYCLGQSNHNLLTCGDLCDPADDTLHSIHPYLQLHASHLDDVIPHFCSHPLQALWSACCPYRCALDKRNVCGDSTYLRNDLTINTPSLSLEPSSITVTVDSLIYSIV